MKESSQRINLPKQMNVWLRCESNNFKTSMSLLYKMQESNRHVDIILETIDYVSESNDE